MRSVQVVEAKARFSSLLDSVESGEEIAITRHGKVIARLLPAAPSMAADVFRTIWAENVETDIEAPADPVAEPVPPLD